MDKPVSSVDDHCDESGASFITEVNILEKNDSASLTSLNETAYFEQSKLQSRTSLYEHDPEKGFTMDIMMMLDTGKVSSLRQEFLQKDRGLLIAEFVHVMIRFVQSATQTEENSRLQSLTEEHLVANLCELFAQIDINGDGSMEWEEFTSFIVDTGLTMKNHQPNSIQQYHHVLWEDCSKHSTFIDRIYYFPSTDLLALVENCSSSLKLYDSNCNYLRSVKSPEGFVQCAEHLPKSNQYVIASSDLQFRFYDDTTLRLVKSCHTPTSQNCLKWYPDSQTLFSADVNGIVYAWDADRMEEKHHMGGEVRGKILARSHDDIVLDLLGLPSLESLASASMDRTIRLWDVHTGKHKQQLDGHTKGVRSLAYSPEYRFLVSAGFDFDALVWNPYVDQLILRLHGHNNSLCGVEIIPDTPQILTADVDGIFKVWDIRNFGCMQTFTAENIGEVKKIVSVGSQKRIIAAGKKLNMFDYEKLINPELTDDNPVFIALYNATSMSFITAAGRDVKIWDARNGKLMRVYRSLTDTDLTTLCLDSRERKFIVGDHEGNIYVFDYLNGSAMKSFTYPEMSDRAHQLEVSKLVYCVEHLTVISASWDCCINIHDESDPEKGILLRQMKGGHTTDITTLAFSCNLSLIASGGADYSLQIWDYEFGRIDCTCIGHVSSILALQFLDPFPLLISSDNMGNICVWAMRPSHLKSKCIYRHRNLRSPDTGGGISSFNCFAVHYEIDETDPTHFVNFLLIGGDDRGTISVWNLMPLLKKLEDDLHVVPLEKPHECANPRRNIRLDVSGIMKKAKRGHDWMSFANRDPNSAFFSPPGTPLISENLFETVQQWKAHSDTIHSIQLISESMSLVTSSFDRQVKIWRLDGECIGILMQGGIEIWKRSWNFVVDHETKERKKDEVANAVLKEVQQMTLSAEKPTERRHKVKIKDDITPLEIDVVEELSRSSGLPFLGSRSETNGNNVPHARRTPRKKPVNTSNAGRSLTQSPRQVRLKEQSLRINIA